MQKFGEELRKQRELCGISQRGLAEKIGDNFSYSYISKVESGIMLPPQNSEVLNKLCDILHLDRHKMYILAHCLPDDLNDYMSEKTNAVKLLRNVKEKNLTNEQIEDLIKMVDHMQSIK
jgi:transcriptional regulator with XRE-family HTH domain